MTDESIFLLSDKQQAYFQRIRSAIFAELHAEGIDTDNDFTVEEDTLQRIAQRLTERTPKINPLATYKKAHKAVTERSFMIMQGGIQTAKLEEYAHLYRLGTGTEAEEGRETPEEHAAFLEELRGEIERSGLFFYQGEREPQNFRALYREWSILRSDFPSFLETPHLSPVFPGSPAYSLLSSLDDWKPPRQLEGHGYKATEYQIQPQSFNASPEQLDALRNALGLPEYRFVNFGIYSELLFVDSFLKAIVDALRQGQTGSGAEDALGMIATETPKVFASPTDSLPLPIDKVNNKIWRLISHAKDNGQIGVDLEAVTSKKGSKKEAIVYAGISFDEKDGMRITRQIDPYDKRVYIAVGGLFSGGNTIFSASQIYRAMGNEGQPSSADVQRINASLDKMGAARLYVDSTSETKVNKGYTSFKYDAPLLPFERMTAYIDNTLCEVAIHLFREPPLITFAKERGQITQITRKLLASPISKTNANLTIEDYLLERIGRMKSPKSNANRKINLSTLFDTCRITAPKQKQRAPKKIKTYLDWYKKTGWIKGYTEDKEGFLIVV